MKESIDRLFDFTTYLFLAFIFGAPLAISTGVYDKMLASVSGQQVTISSETSVVASSD